jgi:DNA-binding MarR family transcriptional regulator
MFAAHTPKQNQLLGALPAADYERLLPQLEPVPLAPGLSVYEARSDNEYVYFPTDSVVSLVDVMRDGSQAEIAVVGNEGVVGIAVFMGGEITPSRAVVQNAGNAYRFKDSVLKREFDRGSPLQYLVLQYSQALITQIAQTTVCSRNHSVEQQLCRWLLLSLDRLHSSELTMAGEAIADMLGVDRSRMADAARRLQAAGLIYRSRDRITVLDRVRLEARVCECYAVVKRESDRVRNDTAAVAGQL